MPGLRLKNVNPQNTILVKIPEKEINESITFIAQVCYLGLVQGFHEKMVDDVVHRIMNNPSVSFKVKQKQRKAFYETDKLCAACQLVIQEASGIIGAMPYFVSDVDIERIWLTIDKFITTHIMPYSFITAIGFFAAIGEALEADICKTPKLQEYLFVVSEEVSDEYYKARREQARKSGNEYDRYVYRYFETSEMDRAVKVADHFLRVFSSRDTFESYAKDRYYEGNNETIETFNRLFPNSYLLSHVFCV